MIQGLRTVVYHVDDLDAAKRWYTAVLGFGPYFDEAFYVGYNVGGFELGLDPDLTGVEKGNSVGAYWGVENIESALQAINEIGTGLVSGPTDVGGGIRVATITDPSGNIFGIIENPNFKNQT
jgi:predicted enzyme related to lactoylglutathione lyase